jgi:oxalyl-CoA decarboxylase
VSVVVLNNGGVYRGDEVNLNELSSDPSPTMLDPAAHHERIIEAFGGTGYQVTTPGQLTAALAAALASRAPSLVDCVLDPRAGTESGHLIHLNPKSAAAEREYAQEGTNPA